MTGISKTTVGLACANGIAFIVGLAITGMLLFDRPQTDFPETNKSTPKLHALIPIENHSLLENPLFQPNRKAIIATSEPTKQIEVPILIPPPVLVGIIQTGKERMILLEDREKKTSGLVRQGESFGDWKIRVIENKSAIIGHTQDENLTMPLNPEQLPAISTEKTTQ